MRVVLYKERFWLREMMGAITVAKSIISINWKLHECVQYDDEVVWIVRIVWGCLTDMQVRIHPLHSIIPL